MRVCATPGGSFLFVELLQSFVNKGSKTVCNNEQIDCPHNDLHPLQYKHRLFFLNIISLVGSCKGSVLEIHCLVHEWNWPCPARIRYLSKKNEILQTQMLLKF